MKLSPNTPDRLNDRELKLPCSSLKLGLEGLRFALSLVLGTAPTLVDASRHIGSRQMLERPRRLFLVQKGLDINVESEDEDIAP